MKIENGITGDIIYFNVLGNSILSVNSYQAANDLLNKKGAIYSDRPRLPMVKELSVLLYRRGFEISLLSAWDGIGT